MTYTVRGIRGQFFPAYGGLICFVPATCITPAGTLLTHRYTKEGWASLNCGVQGATGSHLFPLHLRTPVTPTPEAMAAFAHHGCQVDT